MNFKYLFPAVFKKKKRLKKEDESQETARAHSRVDVLRCPPSVDVWLHLLGGCLKKMQRCPPSVDVLLHLLGGRKCKSPFKGRCVEMSSLGRCLATSLGLMSREDAREKKNV